MGFQPSTVSQFPEFVLLWFSTALKSVETFDLFARLKAVHAAARKEGAQKLAVEEVQHRSSPFFHGRMLVDLRHIPAATVDS